MRRRLHVEIGQRIGRGVVIETDIRVIRGQQERRGARLRCDCGNEYEAWLIQLIQYQGTSQKTSCGCARREHIRKVAYRGGAKPRHGMARKHGPGTHPLYQTWSLIKQRCENPEFHKYPRYGGRGISLCDRWQDVAQFIEDIERELGPKPPRHTLDRIDNDGNYEPGNVQWATPRQQARNQSRQGVSRYHGVRWDKYRGKWIAHIHLGTFDAEEDASRCYESAIAVLQREGIIG